MTAASINAASRVVPTIRTKVAVISSEFQPYRELHASRIADRGHGSEIGCRICWIRARPEIRVSREGVLPIRQIKRFDRAVEHDWPRNRERAAQPCADSKKIASR